MTKTAHISSAHDCKRNEGIVYRNERSVGSFTHKTTSVSSSAPSPYVTFKKTRTITGGDKATASFSINVKEIRTQELNYNSNSKLAGKTIDVVSTRK